MWWHDLFVFLGALIFDLVPSTFPPAFTIMMFFQIIIGLDVWLVVMIGVIGSVLGRYTLLLHAPPIGRIFLKASKNHDTDFLGAKMKENKWKGQLVILASSLLSLPTTLLFLGAGISKITAKYIIPGFLIGKFTTDSLALQEGKFYSENTQSIIQNIFSWQSLGILSFGLLLISSLLFIDWRTLLQTKNLIEL